MTDRRTQIKHAAVRVIARDGVRGLRVERLAAEAGVSTALIYYHFTDRDGILHAALEHVSRQAQSYTEPANPAAPARSRLELILLNELRDTDDVRSNSIAWGELRSSAVFNPALRDSLRGSTGEWDAEIESLVTQTIPTSSDDPAAIASRLTSLVEGLSQRWHSGTITVHRARQLLVAAVDAEVRRPR